MPCRKVQGTAFVDHVPVFSPATCIATPALHLTCDTALISQEKTIYFLIILQFFRRFCFAGEDGVLAADLIAA